MNILRTTTELAMHIVRPYIKHNSTVIDATCGNGHDTLSLANAMIEAEYPKISGSAFAKATIEADNSEVPDSSDETGFGRLFAFDIQQPAIDATNNLLECSGFKAAHIIEAFPDSVSPEDYSFTSGDLSFASDETANTCNKIKSAPHIMPEIFLVRDSHENMDAYVDAADVIVFNLGYFPGGDKSITTTAGSTISAIKNALKILKKDGLMCLTMYSGHAAGYEEKNAILNLAKALDSRQFHVAYINMVNQHNNPPEILLITKK